MSGGTAAAGGSARRVRGGGRSYVSVRVAYKTNAKGEHVVAIIWPGREEREG